MSYKILITCPPMLKQIDQFVEVFSSLGMEITTPEVIQTLTVSELMELVPKHDGWIIGDDPATASVFEAGKAGCLKAAVKWGVGVDNVDFSAGKKLGIPIANTPGMFGAEVADLAMCYILGLARDAFFIDREVRKGAWPKPSGLSLSGKRIGIIGLGDIGKNIAKRAHAHEMEVCGWDPFVDVCPDYVTINESWPLGINECDFIVFACALTEKNKYMFNMSLLENLKPGVKVINVSRGPLINESALIKALSNGSVSAAALDVFEEEPLDQNHPILDYPNCILGSHNGSNTIDAVIRTSNLAIEILNKMIKEAHQS